MSGKQKVSKPLVIFLFYEITLSIKVSNLSTISAPLRMTGKKLVQTNVSLVLFNWLRSNDAKASITSTAVALGDLPKPLTNYVRKVLSTFLTPCRNSSICPNDAKASIISWAIALGDLPKLLTNSFVTLLNLFKLIITGRTLVGSTGLSRYL